MPVLQGAQTAKTNGTSVLNEIYVRLNDGLNLMHQSLSRIEISGHKLSDTNTPDPNKPSEPKSTMSPGFLHDFNTALETLQSLNNRAMTLAEKLENIV